MANLFEGVYEGWSLINKLRNHHLQLKDRWYSINGYTERKRGLFEIIFYSVIGMLEEIIKGSYRALFGFRVKKEKFVHSDGTRLQIPTSKNPEPPIGIIHRAYVEKLPEIVTLRSVGIKLDESINRTTKAGSHERVPPPPRPTIPKERKHISFIEWCKKKNNVSMRENNIDYLIRFICNRNSVLIRFYWVKGDVTMSTTIKASNHIINTDSPKEYFYRYFRNILKYELKNHTPVVANKYDIDIISFDNKPYIKHSSVVDLEPYRPSRLLSRH